MTALLKGRPMSSSGLFSGPPSNKATASTFAVAIATLFWTIAAHTFWKAMSIADMTLYITTSTVLLTAITGFIIPESAAYTNHNTQRLGIGAGQARTTNTAIEALRAGIQDMQKTQHAMASGLGIDIQPNSSALARNHENRADDRLRRGLP